MSENDTRCARGCCASQAEHYRNIKIGTGDLNPEVADMNRRDKQLFADREAYSRLRKDGLQPAHVDGSARVEAEVKDQIELDYQIAIPKEHLTRLKDIQAEVAVNGFAGNPR